MSDFWILLKTNFKILLGTLKYGKRRGKFIPPVLAFALIFGMLAISMTTNAIAQTTEYLKLGVPVYALFYSLTYSMLLVLMVAIMRGATPQKSSDADLMLSLPLKRGTVLVSKSMSRYIFDALPLSVFLLPSLITYYVLAQRSAGMLLRGLLTFFLLPLLSVGVAYILSYFMFKVSAKLPKPELVTTALSLVIVVGFLLLNFKLTGVMGSAEASAELYDNIKPVAWAAHFITEGKPLYFLYLLLMTAAPFAVGIALNARVYGAHVSRWRSKNRAVGFKASSPMAALFRKEAKRYASSSGYIINTIIGPVLAVALTVAVLVGLDGMYGELLGDPQVRAFLPVIFAGAFGFMAAMTFISASSISLEGKNIWVLRVSPVDEKDVFLAKILFNVAVALPTSIICPLVVSLKLGFSLPETLFTVFMPALCALLISVAGLYVNLLFPKLEWDNETLVVKQSMAATIAVFGGMALCALPVALFFIMAWADIGLKTVICALFYIVLTFVFWILCMTDGRKRFRELC